MLRYSWLWRIFIFVILFGSAFSDEHTHVYEEGEQIVLWMNTVGPYHNLQETYAYFKLPFCKGEVKNVEHYHETLAEALQGIELDFSGLDIRFKQSVKKTEFCRRLLTEAEASQLISAIVERYWYQMYLDELSLVGVVGEMRDGKAMLWTHKKFEILFNHNQIVGVSLGTSDPIEVAAGAEVIYTYEVTWIESKLPFENRYDYYLDASFYQHRIHWFSIFNSFMMVIFLVVLVSMILLRTLRKDYARYNREDSLEDLERELGDEYGWKQVHGDVFRCPAGILYFSSLIGNGVHITVVSLIVALLALIGKMYTERGGVLSTIIFVYALFSPVNGFIGGRTYLRLGGKNWILQLFLGSLLMPTLVVIIALGINTLALFYQTSRVLPFLTMLAVFAIIVFVILPLNLVGTVLGRNVGRSIGTSASGMANPCRVNSVPRPIPASKWFTKPLAISFIGGVLPFGSIFIEMYVVLEGTLTLNDFTKLSFNPQGCMLSFGSCFSVFQICYFCMLLVIKYLRMPVFKSSSSKCMIVEFLLNLYFIFTSFWAYKVYYVYGFTLLVIFILIVVTGCSTVVCTYFLLNAEDYRWQWISFFSGASTAVYVYIYSIYYFLFKTKMFGLFQTAFYFSYMAFFCFALGCMCGAIGYLSANRFVRTIYSTVKIE
ncbi:Transmembrane 9 superfamily member [Echinococcus granulosus]|uniref:Transmembrane 9 superfamily member n=1 Tax=Echinococcus granulosus TaxID=6210 RepID=W6VCS2_ECHGR|nr:Transmembrane 9 superfamily member [Echinococcus granulosus]EUB64714.1 Transmembrane 9 superfamily member [Echinococcus granulosus]